MRFDPVPRCAVVRERGGPRLEACERSRWADNFELRLVTNCFASATGGPHRYRDFDSLSSKSEQLNAASASTWRLRDRSLAIFGIDVIWIPEQTAALACGYASSPSRCKARTTSMRCGKPRALWNARPSFSMGGSEVRSDVGNATKPCTVHERAPAGIWAKRTASTRSTDPSREVCAWTRGCVGDRARRLRRHLKTSSRIRRLFTKRADHEIDELLGAITSDDDLQRVIRRTVRLNWHGELIRAIWRHPRRQINSASHAPAL